MHDDLHLSEEYVKIRLNSGRLELLLDDKPSTLLIVIIDHTSGSVPNVGGQCLRCKVDTVIRDAESNIIGTTGLVHGIAKGPCLRKGGGNKDCDENGQCPNECGSVHF